MSDIMPRRTAAKNIHILRNHTKARKQDERYISGQVPYLDVITKRLADAELNSADPKVRGATDLYIHSVYGTPKSAHALVRQWFGIRIDGKTGMDGILYEAFERANGQHIARMQVDSYFGAIMDIVAPVVPGGNVNIAESAKQIRHRIVARRARLADSQKPKDIVIRAES
jgi:hypothetical protein